MEILLILILLVVTISVYFMCSAPSECYECGHRFKDTELRWYNEDKRDLCYSCYLKETGGEL